MCVFFCHQGRTNLPPEKVPWDAFRTLLSQCIYGGKIDNEFDQVCLVMTSCHNGKICCKAFNSPAVVGQLKFC